TWPYPTFCLVRAGTRIWFSPRAEIHIGFQSAANGSTTHIGLQPAAKSSTTSRSLVNRTNLGTGTFLRFSAAKEKSRSPEHRPSYDRDMVRKRGRPEQYALYAASGQQSFT